MLVRQVAGVESLQDNHPWVGPESGVYKTFAHIDCVDFPCAVLQQAVGEAAR